MGPGSRSRGGKRQVPHCKHLQEQVPSNQFLLKHKKSLKQDPPLPSTIMGFMNQKKQLKAMEMIPLPTAASPVASRPEEGWEMLQRAAPPPGSCSALPTPKGSAGDIVEEEGFFLPPPPTAIFCHGSSVFLGEDHLVTSKSLNTPGQGLGPVAWPCSCPHPPAGTTLAQLSPGIWQSPSWHQPTPCWGVHLQQESGHPWFTMIIINCHYH